MQFKLNFGKKIPKHKNMYILELLKFNIFFQWPIELLDFGLIVTNKTLYLSIEPFFS